MKLELKLAYRFDLLKASYRENAPRGNIRAGRYEHPHIYLILTIRY